MELSAVGLVFVIPTASGLLDRSVMVAVLEAVVILATFVVVGWLVLTTDVGGVICVVTTRLQNIFVNNGV